MRHAPYFIMIVLGSMSAMAQSNPGYRVTNLSSLGGTVSSGNSLDDLGLITGASNLAGDQIEHAALWFGELKADLGTLGGLNSAVLWPVKNNIGLIAGISQTTIPDPLSESWSCSAFLPTSTGTTCVGFAWSKTYPNGAQAWLFLALVPSSKTGGRVYSLEGGIAPVVPG